MQFIDFLTFIAMMVLITFILRNKKSNQNTVQEMNNHVVKSKRTENFSEEEEFSEKLDSSSIQTELSELQRLLLGTKRQKKTITTTVSPECINLEKETKTVIDAYDIIPEKKVRNAATLIQKTQSKKDLILIHEIFDKPKSLR